MLTVTDAAFARLNEILADHPTEIAARIVRKGDRMCVRRGKQRPGDETVKHDGKIVLLLAKSIVKRLRGRVLDVRETQDGPKLGLRRDRNDATAN